MNWKTRPVDEQDQGIEQRLSTQSRDFYQKVYREYSNAILGFFRSQGYTPEEARDGLQDVYLRVIRLSQPKQIAQSPKAYLLKVATNLIRDHYRKQAAVKLITQDILELDDIPTLEQSPEKKLQITQQLEIVKNAIMELSHDHREIFLMHRIDGMTCKQIAASMQMPLRTVQRRLGDALAYCVVKLNKETGVNT